MKIIDLLNEVKNGKAETHVRNRTTSIIENYDKDFEMYRLSNLLEEASAKIGNADVCSKVRKAIDKIKLFEEKLESGKELSVPYLKLKMDNLIEDYNSLSKSLEDRRLTKEINKEAVGQAMAIIEYKINDIKEMGGFEVVSLREDSDVMKPFITKEYKILEETLNE
jgi:hypothetical protein